MSTQLYCYLISRNGSLLLEYQLVLETKNKISIWDVEQILLHVVPRTSRYFELKLVLLSLRMTELIVTHRRQDGKWDTPILERILLMEYEFIEMQADRISASKLKATRERIPWSTIYNSVLQTTDPLLIERIEKTKKIYNSPHGIVAKLLWYVLSH